MAPMTTVNGFVDDVNGWDFQGSDKNPTPSQHDSTTRTARTLRGSSRRRTTTTRDQRRLSGLHDRGAADRHGGVPHPRERAEGDQLRDRHNHADVINLSLGDPVWSKAERAAIARAGKAGILVVVAAGNSSMDNDIQFYEHPQGQPPSWAPSYPASYTLKNILAVAASNDRDQYGYVSQCQSQHIPLWQCGFTSWGMTRSTSRRRASTS